MRWRALAVLYVVAVLLGVTYWALERPLEPEAAREGAPRARVFSVEPEGVVRLELVAGSSRVVVTREAAEWTVVAPANRPIPRDLILAFVESLVGTEVIDRVPADVDAAERFGFTPPTARVSLWDRAGARWDLEIGAVSPTGTAVYVRQPDGDVALVGRQAQYYLDLIIGSVRGAPIAEPDAGRPVASSRLTIGHRAG